MSTPDHHPADQSHPTDTRPRHDSHTPTTPTIPIPLSSDMQNATDPQPTASSSRDSTPTPGQTANQPLPLPPPPPPPPPAAPNPGANDAPPRIPWAGPVPSFFIMGPGGTILPHFLPRTSQPASENPAPSPGAGNPAEPIAPRPPNTPLQPTIFPFPGFTPAMGGANPFFSLLIPTPGLREPRPDPEAAAELLRSLPTVSKGLFRRVQNVITAEQTLDDEDEENRGWKCGVCLEGVEEGAKETGVKVLPCNHLFHGDCLEPWFTSHHTCPTCRLDLDPGRTLRGHSRPAFRRPAATGSGRQTPHPYTRNGADTPTETANPLAGVLNHDPSPNNAGNDTASAADPARQPPTLPPFDFFARALGTNDEAGDRNGPEITFIWRLPTPPPAPRPSSTEQPQATPSSGDAPSGQTGSTENPPQPQTPMFTFDFPFTASPTPMTAETGPTPEHVSSTPQASTSGPTTDRQQPEAREEGTSGPSDSEQNRPGTQQHHHQLRPPGLSTPSPSHAALPTANEESNSTTTGTGGGGQASQTDRQRPHFHFIFGLTDGIPGLTPTAPAQRPAETEPTPAPAPVERPSLTAWVEGRERQLGWRCDAPECGIAPTDDDDEDVPMPTEGDKEMLSIYSELQPGPLAVEEAEGNGRNERSFEIHACAHRWHRTCLETAERTSGRPMRVDDQGRCWVRCEKCRTDGWVRGRLRSLSESEVERLVLRG